MNDNIYNWKVALIVTNPDSLYYGGYFDAKMTFPSNYPYSPPGTDQANREGAMWGGELTISQISGSFVHYSIPMSTMTADCASPSCIPQEMTKCLAKAEICAGRLCNG